MFTHVLSSCTFGHRFIDPAFLLPGQNEYTIRFIQNPAQNRQWRPVTYDEIELLVKNGNTCTNWQEFLVEDLHAGPNKEFFFFRRHPPCIADRMLFTIP